jgi:hypothetical protein
MTPLSAPTTCAEHGRSGGPGEQGAGACRNHTAKAQAERALDAGLAPARGTGDDACGRSGELCGVPEACGIGYV